MGVGSCGAKRPARARSIVSPRSSIAWPPASTAAARTAIVRFRRVASPVHSSPPAQSASQSGAAIFRDHLPLPWAAHHDPPDIQILTGKQSARADGREQRIAILDLGHIAAGADFAQGSEFVLERRRPRLRPG